MHSLSYLVCLMGRRRVCTTTGHPSHSFITNAQLQDADEAAAARSVAAPLSPSLFPLPLF